MQNNTWQPLFTQLLQLAKADKATAEAKDLAQQWEHLHNELEEGPRAEDYYAYYKNTQQDSRQPETDLVDQQKWYDQLQQVQLFVQDLLHPSP